MMDEINKKWNEFKESVDSIIEKEKKISIEKSKPFYDIPENIHIYDNGYNFTLLFNDDRQRLHIYHGLFEVESTSSEEWTNHSDKLYIIPVDDINDCEVGDIVTHVDDNNNYLVNWFVINENKDIYHIIEDSKEPYNIENSENIEINNIETTGWLKVTVWECEECGEWYDNEEEALWCERRDRGEDE